MLRGTAGGEIAIWFCCCYCRCFLTPPSFGHLPYILRCKTQGRRIATQPFSPYCFVAPRNVAGHVRGEVEIWFCCRRFRCFLTSLSFGHLPYILLCTTQGRRVIAKIQVCPHEFSTESYLLPDVSWKLIALFLVLPVVVSVIGVIAYVLINSYFSRISYWISRR